MYSEELLIGSIRAQANRLRRILEQMESDSGRQEHAAYYEHELREVERGLRAIRKNGLERSYASTELLSTITEMA